MITNYQKEVDEDYYKKLHKREQADESIMLKESPFIAFFARILLSFFNTQPQVRAKRKKGANHPKTNVGLCLKMKLSKPTLNNTGTMNILIM